MTVGRIQPKPEIERNPGALERVLSTGKEALGFRVRWCGSKIEIELTETRFDSSNEIQGGRVALSRPPWFLPWHFRHYADSRFFVTR